MKRGNSSYLGITGKYVRLEVCVLLSAVVKENYRNVNEPNSVHTANKVRVCQGAVRSVCKVEG